MRSMAPEICTKMLGYLGEKLEKDLLRLYLTTRWYKLPVLMIFLGNFWTESKPSRRSITVAIRWVKKKKETRLKKIKEVKSLKAKALRKFWFPPCPSKNVLKADSSGKKDMLTVTCCKCLFYQVAANLASILAKNTQNVPKIRSGQKAPGIKEKDKSWTLSAMLQLVDKHGNGWCCCAR